MTKSFALRNDVAYSLGEVISINPSSIGKDCPHQEIQYVDISSVSSGVLNGMAVHNIDDAPSRAKRLVKEGDTILSTVRPNRRSFLFIKNPPENIVVSTGFAVLRASDKIEPGFLYYTVTNQPFTDYLTANAKGAAYPAVDTETIARAEIRVPPLPIQHKIASILSAYDDLIENNLRRIKILEEMAQTIYREWFVKFRFPGHEKTRMVDSPMGKIPEGWELKTVGDTFEILGGGTPSKKIEKYWAEGDIMWYVPSDLTASKTMFMDSSSTQITELGLTKSSARLFSPFSVMMTSRATLGVIAINTTEASTNQGFITCLPNERFPLHNLYHWLMENVETFISLSSGATFKEITKGVFKTIEMVIPDKNIARAFEDNVEPLAEHVLNLQRKNENLKRTRDLLLPKLISGELNVSDLNILHIKTQGEDISHE